MRRCTTVKMSPHLLCVLGLLATGAACVTAALADEPPGRDAADPARAEMFVKAAKVARSADDALAALDHALQQDPDHLEANLLRAERLVEKRQIGPANEQIARVKELIRKQAEPPAEVKARLANLEKALDGMREQATRWSATKQLFSARYKDLVDPRAVTLLPSTTLALRRATLLAPADKDLAAQYEAIQAQTPRLPVAAIYDIRLEKIAGKVTVWVNSIELLELKLPKDMLANFAKTPVGAHVWHGDWWSGQENWAGPYEMGMKVSVVELAMAKKLTPWRPK